MPRFGTAHVKCNVNQFTRTRASLFDLTMSPPFRPNKKTNKHEAPTALISVESHQIILSSNCFWTHAPSHYPAICHICLFWPAWMRCGVLGWCTDACRLQIFAFSKHDARKKLACAAEGRAEPVYRYLLVGINKQVCFFKRQE